MNKQRIAAYSGDGKWTKEASQQLKESQDPELLITLLQWLNRKFDCCVRCAQEPNTNDQIEEVASAAAVLWNRALSLGLCTALLDNSKSQFEWLLTLGLYLKQKQVLPKDFKNIRELVQQHFDDRTQLNQNTANKTQFEALYFIFLADGASALQQLNNTTTEYQTLLTRYNTWMDKLCDLMSYAWCETLKSLVAEYPPTFELVVCHLLYLIKMEKENLSKIKKVLRDLVEKNSQHPALKHYPEVYALMLVNSYGEKCKIWEKPLFLEMSFSKPYLEASGSQKDRYITALQCSLGDLLIESQEELTFEHYMHLWYHLLEIAKTQHQNDEPTLENLKGTIGWSNKILLNLISDNLNTTENLTELVDATKINRSNCYWFLTQAPYHCKQTTLFKLMLIFKDELSTQLKSNNQTLKQLLFKAIYLKPQLPLASITQHMDVREAIPELFPHTTQLIKQFNEDTNGIIFPDQLKKLLIQVNANYDYEKKQPSWLEKQDYLQLLQYLNKLNPQQDSFDFDDDSLDSPLKMLHSNKPNSQQDSLDFKDDSLEYLLDMPNSNKLNAPQNSFDFEDDSLDSPLNMSNSNKLNMHQDFLDSKDDLFDSSLNMSNLNKLNTQQDFFDSKDDLFDSMFSTLYDSSYEQKYLPHLRQILLAHAIQDGLSTDALKEHLLAYYMKDPVIFPEDKADVEAFVETQMVTIDSNLTLQKVFAQNDNKDLRSQARLNIAKYTDNTNELLDYLTKVTRKYKDQRELVETILEAVCTSSSKLQLLFDRPATLENSLKRMHETNSPIHLLLAGIQYLKQIKATKIKAIELQRQFLEHERMFDDILYDTFDKVLWQLAVQASKPPASTLAKTAQDEGMQTEEEESKTKLETPAELTCYESIIVKFYEIHKALVGEQTIDELLAAMTPPDSRMMGFAELVAKEYFPGNLIFAMRDCQPDYMQRWCYFNECLFANTFPKKTSSGALQLLQATLPILFEKAVYLHKQRCKAKIVKLTIEKETKSVKVDDQIDKLKKKQAKLSENLPETKTVFSEQLTKMIEKAKKREEKHKKAIAQAIAAKRQAEVEKAKRIQAAKTRNSALIRRMYSPKKKSRTAFDQSEINKTTDKTSAHTQVQSTAKIVGTTVLVLMCIINLSVVTLGVLGILTAHALIHVPFIMQVLTTLNTYVTPFLNLYLSSLSFSMLGVVGSIASILGIAKLNAKVTKPALSTDSSLALSKLSNTDSKHRSGFVIEDAAIYTIGQPFAKQTIASKVAGLSDEGLQLDYGLEEGVSMDSPTVNLVVPHC